MTSCRFFATTARGLEPLLAGELRALGASSVKPSHGGVFFEGPPTLAWRANLWLRTANRVLRPLVEFPCSSYDALYQGVATVDWSQHLTAKHTLAVEAGVFQSPLTHSHHAALRIKDAIVDQMRRRGGRRPDVDPKDPDVRIHAYIHKETCQLSLDLSGDPLFMRGYRVSTTAAPLKETLAAAVVLLSGWDRRAPLYDPLCGSGTIVIEAAMLALDIAPGRRRTFGFQRHPGYTAQDAATFEAMLEEASARIRPASSVRIVASDHDPEAVAAARANARAAGVAESIQLSVADARQLPPVEPGSFIISNPPYGQRLGGTSASVESLYRMLGHRLKTFPPTEVWMLSAAPGFERALGLPVKARHRLFNGPLETWLYGCRVGEGGRKRR